MYPKLWIFDTYGILIALGVLACFGYLEIYFRRRKADRRLILDIEINALVAIIIGLLFAVLFQNLYDFIENPSSYQWTWALTFYGGLIGGAISFLSGHFFFLEKHYPGYMKDFLPIAPACISVAHGFGRIGCFLAGCCYGGVTDSPLGVLFPGMEHKVWPTNLFEAIFLLVLSSILLFLAMKKNRSSLGPAIYLIAYGIWRFLIEYLRGDHRGQFIPGLTPSQFWSIIMVIGGLLYLFILYRIKKKKTLPLIIKDKEE